MGTLFSKIKEKKSKEKAETSVNKNTPPPITDNEIELIQQALVESWNNKEKLLPQIQIVEPSTEDMIKLSAINRAIYYYELFLQTLRKREMKELLEKNPEGYQVASEIIEELLFNLH